MKEKLLQKANELNITVLGKENSITIGQIITLARELQISGFKVTELISELNN